MTMKSFLLNIGQNRMAPMGIERNESFEEIFGIESDGRNDN